MWPNDIAALAWMPWVVLAVERAWQKGGRALVWGALAGVIQMLAGAPEVIALTWVMVGALWVMQFATGEISRVRMVLRAGLVVVLVAGLAAAQLLPFFELLAHSHRDDSYGSSAWAMPATGLANYLVPLFHCVAAHQGVYMQNGQYWTSSYYVGVGVVALGLLGVWRVRDRRVWLLGLLVALSLLMALGDHGGLYPVLKKLVPQMGFIRFPIKFVVLATFALPLLAAYGVAWLRGLPAQDQPPEWKRLMGLTAAFMGLIIVILFCAWKFPEAGDDLKMTLRNGVRSAVFLSAVPVGLLFLSGKIKLRSRQIIQTALIVLLWMDVFTHVPTLSPTVPSRIYQADLMRQYFMKNDPKWDAEIRLGNARVMQTLESFYKMYWGGLENGMDDAFGRRVTLFNNVNLLDHIPKLDGFYSLYVREPNTVIDYLYESSNDVPHLTGLSRHRAVNPPDQCARMGRPRHLCAVAHRGATAGLFS